MIDALTAAGDGMLCLDIAKSTSKHPNRTRIGPAVFTLGARTSGLSGLSLGWAAESSEGALERRRRAGAGYAPPGRMRITGLAAAIQGGGGINGPDGPADTGHRRAGPICRMRAVHCAISGGTRSSPHHPFHQSANRCPAQPFIAVSTPSRHFHYKLSTRS